MSEDKKKLKQKKNVSGVYSAFLFPLRILTMPKPPLLADRLFQMSLFHANAAFEG